MATTYYILLIACLFAIGVQRINLANSAYPMYRANREKNNQLNATVSLDPSVDL